jgi:hypothetical protein
MKIILYIFEEMRDCLLVASRQNQIRTNESIHTPIFLFDSSTSVRRKVGI